MEKLIRYNEQRSDELKKEYYKNRIESLKKEIEKSKVQLKKDIRKLKHTHSDYVGRLEKQIIELRTQLRKLD